MEKYELANSMRMDLFEIKIIQNIVKKNATRVDKRYELANLFSSREKWEDNKVMWENKIWENKIKIIQNLSAVQKE